MSLDKRLYPLEEARFLKDVENLPFVNSVYLL
jgi:hypothetical protein